MLRAPRRSTLFPYTTLFRSIRASQKAEEAVKEKGRADDQAEVAKANARLANGRAYISDLRLVQRAWEENQVGLVRSEEHTSELQSHSDLVCRLLLEKKKK